MASEPKTSKPPIVLSIVGYTQRDPNGIYLVDTLLTEQIQSLISGAKILHVVLESHEKVMPQDTNTIGYIIPLGHPKEAPNPRWINFYFQAFYEHLRNYDVTHILGHAPEFIWGALSIKSKFFPKAIILMVVHEQINHIENGDNGNQHQPGENLARWSDQVEVVLSLGSTTYADVERLLFAHNRFFEDEKKLCYLPKPPKRFAEIGPWARPPATSRPIILILAGDLHTQKRQKMDLRLMMKAITAVAEQLNKLSLLKKIIVKVVGVPSEQQQEVAQKWNNVANSYVNVEFIAATTYDLLEIQLKTCCMCILPLGCSSDAYGLEMMIPVTFGVPMLLPDSASIISDAEKMTAVEGYECQLSLATMVVRVMAAQKEEEEIMAWRDKITYMLIEQDQAYSCAAALRRALINSDFIRKNGQQLIDLLKIPSRKIQEAQYEAAALAVRSSEERINLPPPPYSCLRKETRKQAPNSASVPPSPRSVLIEHWVRLVNTIDLPPLLDAMHAQATINYVEYEELRKRINEGYMQTAVHELLCFQRRKGELGITQLMMGLQAVDSDLIKLFLDPPAIE